MQKRRKRCTTSINQRMINVPRNQEAPQQQETRNGKRETLKRLIHGNGHVVCTWSRQINAFPFSSLTTTTAVKSCASRNSSSKASNLTQLGLKSQDGIHLLTPSLASMVPESQTSSMQFASFSASQTCHLYAFSISSVAHILLLCFIF